MTSIRIQRLIKGRAVLVERNLPTPRPRAMCRVKTIQTMEDGEKVYLDDTLVFPSFQSQDESLY